MPLWAGWADREPEGPCTADYHLELAQSREAIAVEVREHDHGTNVACSGEGTSAASRMPATVLLPAPGEPATTHAAAVTLIGSEDMRRRRPGMDTAHAVDLDQCCWPANVGDADAGHALLARARVAAACAWLMAHSRA
jgi:hypothetical protein